MQEKASNDAGASEGDRLAAPSALSKSSLRLGSTTLTASRSVQAEGYAAASVRSFSEGGSE